MKEAPVLAIDAGKDSDKSYHVCVTTYLISVMLPIIGSGFIFPPAALITPMMKNMNPIRYPMEEMIHPNFGIIPRIPHTIVNKKRTSP